MWKHHATVSGSQPHHGHGHGPCALLPERESADKGMRGMTVRTLPMHDAAEVGATCGRPPCSECRRRQQIAGGAPLCGLERWACCQQGDRRSPLHQQHPSSHRQPQPSSRHRKRPSSRPLSIVTPAKAGAQIAIGSSTAAAIRDRLAGNRCRGTPPPATASLDAPTTASPQTTTAPSLPGDLGSGRRRNDDRVGRRWAQLSDGDSLSSVGGHRMPLTFVMAAPHPNPLPVRAERRERGEGALGPPTVRPAQGSTAASAGSPGREGPASGDARARNRG